MSKRPVRQNKPVEPEVGSWVIAEIQHCTDRLLWQHRPSGLWIDKHGCAHPWEELVDPIDVLGPEE